MVQYFLNIFSCTKLIPLEYTQKHIAFVTRKITHRQTCNQFQGQHNYLSHKSCSLLYSSLSYLHTSCLENRMYTSKSTV